MAKAVKKKPARNKRVTPATVVRLTDVNTAAEHIVAGLEVLGYSVVIWHPEETNEIRAERIEEHGAAVLDLFTSDEIFDRLVLRDDWTLKAAAENLTDQDVIEECGSRQIKLADEDDWLPVVQSAYRAAFAGMGDLYDRLADLQHALGERGIRSTATGDLITRIG